MIGGSQGEVSKNPGLNKLDMIFINRDIQQSDAISGCTSTIAEVLIFSS
jgi:hypothetical protein